MRNINTFFSHQKKKKKMTFETIDELTHTIVNIAHTERLYLESNLLIKKLEIAKEPFDELHEENVSKVYSLSPLETSRLQTHT